MTRRAFHPLCLDNFANASVFTRLYTLARVESLSSDKAPEVFLYGMHVLKQFRDTVRVTPTAFDPSQLSEMAFNLYHHIRGSVTLWSLSIAVERLRDEKVPILAEWIEGLLLRVMTHCNWSGEHQTQLSNIKQDLEQWTIFEFMYALTDSGGTWTPERFVAKTKAMLALLKETPFNEITLDQVKMVLNDNTATV